MARLARIAGAPIPMIGARSRRIACHARPADEIVDADRAVEAEAEHDQARQHDRPRGAVDAETEAEDQQRIGEDGGDGAGQRHVHRAPRVADRAQHARQRHGERERDIGRDGDGEEAAGDRRRLAARVQQQIERRVAQQQHDDRQRGRHDAGDRQAGGGEAARALPVAGAERARHGRRNGDGEADRHRQRDELQLAGVADRRLQVLRAEPRDPEQRQEVDGEHRHQADRAGRGHHRDVAHGRAAREYGRVVAGGGGGGHAADLKGAGRARGFYTVSARARQLDFAGAAFQDTGASARLTNAMTSKPPLRIVLCAPRGFCAGVVRAIDAVEKALEIYGAPVYVRHEIVHNKHVVDSLKAKGVVFIGDLAEAPAGDRPVIFSAHGVAKAVPEEARARNLLTIDATCPLVTKVHREAQVHHKRGRHVLLIGHPGHPEVIGTMGQLPAGATTLIGSVDEVEALDFPADAPLAYVTQTTLSVDDTREIVAALKRRFPAIARAAARGHLLRHHQSPGGGQARGGRGRGGDRRRLGRIRRIRSACAKSPSGRAARSPCSRPTRRRSTGRALPACARSPSPPAPRRRKSWSRRSSTPSPSASPSPSRR